ncbi:MAG TPA: hypothetical protein VFD82_12135 [Planctomycetota bacterium]|nr:hypothetical protein [Planctomycetota bacterium]
MRSEKRRQRGIFGAIVADPYRKLAALVLASGLWFFINAQITNSLTFRSVPLVAVGSQRVRAERVARLAVVLPTDLVVLNRFMDADRPIDHVDVVLSGPRRRLDQFKDALLDLEITKYLTLEDWETRTSIEITAGDISLDRTMDDLHIDLIPPRIRVEVSKIDKHPLPLSLDVIDVQADQLGTRLRRDTASFQPETAWILGRASAIEKFRQRGGKQQLRAIVKSVGSEKQVSTGLEIIGGAELGLRFQDTPVVTMEVLPQTAVFELELLIAVDDLALGPEGQGQYQPETRSRIVRIRAGGELRSKLVLLKEDADKRALPDWVNGNLRLHVFIPRPESGASYGQEIDRQARVLLLGPLQASVDRTECLLDESVVVKLRRGP